jgi:hypothetical protein
VRGTTLPQIDLERSVFPETVAQMGDEVDAETAEHALLFEHACDAQSGIVQLGRVRRDRG